MDFFVEGLQLFCGEHGIDIPEMNARYTAGRALVHNDHIAIEHHFRANIFTIVCDAQLEELNNRFKDDVMELLVLRSALDPRDGYKSFNIEDICKLANICYLDHFTE